MDRWITPPKREAIDFRTYFVYILLYIPLNLSEFTQVQTTSIKSGLPVCG